MSDKFTSLLDEIRHLEKTMIGAARHQEAAHCAGVHAQKRKLTAAARGWYHDGDFIEILHSRFMVLITSPLIWLCAIPIALADLVGTVYQTVCFPIYGIPKVRRADYLAFDRHHLDYLSLSDKLSCEYCAYVNGILAYFTEIAARTEQHWCPIKHAGCEKCAHSRYKKFIPYGDAEKYRRQFETIRNAYEDIAPAEDAPPPRA